ncbi:glutathione peroxidase [Paenibacillus spiritus]|uniref:Glutathione peroxidase n=1 Tax=Paenibacillus spiritus TaxID=2496557 RepID=A0A5J5FYF2_9BACL|nr:glutathione peroxidase [Paenibacillus spiritus]KAA8998780.1 glutathione peroxidase [Paenibacillus spiritus]
MNATVYDYTARTIRGTEISLGQYRGKVLLIVNTASQCGFTTQYADLQKLYDKYAEQGLVILGFPSNQFGGQEPGTNEEVHTFCQLNYGVTFPLFEKIEVRGEDKHPLYAHLIHEAGFRGFDAANPAARMLKAMLEERNPGDLATDEIKWNFTKFLIDRSGHVAERFETPVDPLDIEPAIESLL